MGNIRQERANSEVSKALADILRNRLNNPFLQKQFITITYVNLSVDFRHAKVGVSVFKGNTKEVIETLTKSEGYIKRELMKEVKLPYTPELKFIEDDGAEHSDNINAILQNLVIPELTEEDEDIDF